MHMTWLACLSGVRLVWLSSMAEEVRDVQSKAKMRLEQTNAKYNVATNKHRQPEIFEERNSVMVF